MSGCGNAGLRRVAAGLSHCKGVRKLDLSWNACDDGSILSSIIQSLSGSLEVVNVRGNLVDSDGVVSVCKALSTCSKLSVANVSHSPTLHGNGVGVVPLSCVCEVVESCPNLCTLYTRRYGFQYDDDCLERLVRAVQSNAVLRKLWVTPYCANARLVSRLELLIRDVTWTLSTDV